MLIMNFHLRFQCLLLLVSARWGCTALADWTKITPVALQDSTSMEKHLWKRRVRSLDGIISRPPQHRASGQRIRTSATAVASSPSHLVTGRSASGVLENCIEACVNTLGSFIGGTITGYMIGAFVGGTFGKVPDVGLFKSVRMKAGQMGGDWGKLTAAFTGFTSLSTVIRGSNDQWDQVVGAAAAGAFLNRAKGPSGMIQGAATYGLFSLIFASQSKQDPMDVVDVPVNAPTKQ